MSINLDKITTKADLKQVLKFLEEQGFGYIGEWDLHQKKISDIISKNNTLNIKYDDKFKSKLAELQDYDEANKQASEFFSKFSADDKIMEILNEFYLQSDDECRTPYSRPDTKDIIKWFEFKTKYNLIDEYGTGTYISFYNLDKNFLKIHYGQYKDYDFKKLYQLIFNEEPKDFDSKRSGEWIDVGRIQIKFFLKGGANIKGELDKYKKYYYQYLTDKSSNTLIKYNNKIEMYNKKNLD